MSIYAIADTHLSFGTNKPMDSFPGWNDYVSRIENNWKKLITDNDTVVIAGDISWAMNFDELYDDFKFLNDLPGTKIILKGNHDYWWNTVTKLNAFIENNSFDTLKILNNNSYDVEGVSICGSRGWMFESEEEHDELILAREVGRLKLSLTDAKNDEIIAFLHYPPVTVDTKCMQIIDALKEYNVKKCYYGHLHGSAARLALNDNVEGIDFQLVSCDKLGFMPLLIKK